MTQQSDNTDLQEESSEPTPFFTRRRLMKGTAGIAGAGTVVGLGAWYSTQPSLAQTFTENEEGVVLVETNDGELTDVQVAPVFEISWADFGDGVASFSFDIQADVNGSTATIYDVTEFSDSTDTVVDTFESDTLSDYTGTATITCVQESILGDGITTSDFPTAVTDGSSQSQTVTLTLSVSGTTNLGSQVSAESATASFEVTIENPDATMTTSLNETNAEVEANTTSSST